MGLEFWKIYLQGGPVACEICSRSEAVSQSRLVAIVIRVSAIVRAQSRDGRDKCQRPGQGTFGCASESRSVVSSVVEGLKGDQ